MAGVELATAYVALTVETRNLAKDATRSLAPVEKQAEATGRRAGGRLSKGFGETVKHVGGIFAGMFAAEKIGEFFKDAIGGASDLAESGTKLNQIFGKAGSEAVNQFAAKGAKALGQSKLEVLDAAGTFGVYGKAAGLSGKANAKFATGFAGLATDLASFHNADPSEVVDALGAALRGESEPMRRFGVLIDDASLRQEALKQGLIKTTKQALTPQQKVLAAQALVYKQTKDAQGDFARTSGGLANQQRILSATFTDMKSEIGQKLLPLVTKLFTFMNNTAIPAINGLVKGFQDGTGWGGKIAAVLGFLGDHMTLVKAAAATLVGSIVSWKIAQAGLNAVNAINLIRLKAQTVGTLEQTVVSKAAAAASKVWAAGQWLVNAALSANPIGIVVVAIGALIAGIVLLYKHNQTAKAIIDAVWKGIKGAISSTVGWFTGTAWPAVKSAVSAIGQGFKDLWSGVTTAWNAIKSAISAVVTWFRDTAVAILKAYIGVYVAAGKAMWNSMKAIWNGIKTAISAVVSWFRDTAVAIWKREVAGWTRIGTALWNGLKKIWSGIKSAISAVVNWFRDSAVALWKREVAGFKNAGTILWDGIKRIWTGIKNAISPVISWFRDTAVKIWKREVSGFSTAISNVWNHGIKPVFGALKTGIGQVSDKFSTAKTAIARSWNALEGIAKKPIHFILDTVINKGLVGGFNWLSGKIGGPHVSNVPLPFANGGVLPGYSPGKDIHQFYSPTGGRLALSGGEAFMRPEFTKLVGGERGVNALNSMARSGKLPFQAFKSGGVWDWIKGKSASAFNWVGDKASATWKAVTDPKKFLEARLAKITGSDMLSKIGQGAVGKLVGAAVNKAKGLYKSFEGAFGGAFDGGGAGGSGVARWRGVAMKAMDAAGLPGAYLNLLLRRMNVESGGNPNAINNWDINAKNGVPSQGLMQVIPPTFAAYAGPFRNMGLRNPFANIYAAIKYTLARYGLGGIGRAWGGTAGYKDGGVFPKPLLFDSGGVLPMGTSLVHNATGAPEPLARVDQMRGNTTVYMNVSVDDLAKMSKLSDFYEMLDNARVTSRKTLRSGRVSS